MFIVSNWKTGKIYEFAKYPEAEKFYLEQPFETTFLMGEVWSLSQASSVQDWLKAINPEFRAMFERQ